MLFACGSRHTQASLLGVNRVLEPPDPISNSEVKRYIADGSVGLPHVRVGQRQAFIPKALFEISLKQGFFYACSTYSSQ